MPKSKTQEEFENELFKINPNIQVLGKYTGNASKIHCKCRIDEYEWNPIPNHLLKGIGCPRCSKKERYTQNTFQEKLYKINPNIEVLGLYINARTRIHCKCKIDGYEWNPTPDNLLHKKGCPVCANKKVMIGVNDICTTNFKLSKLLANPEDGYKYTQQSDKYVSWKCPICGNIIKNRQIAMVCSNGLSCPKCSDGISYPEKFMYNLLQQLDVEFEYQKKFDWCKYDLDGKQKYGIYDFYIPFENIIIETDGIWHKQDNKISGQSKEESKYIDNEKDKLAKEHNLEVIRIDCEISDIEYIKNNIFNSSLVNIFDLSNIDWIKISKNSHKSLVKEVCSLWNQYQNINYIVNALQIGRTTVSKYLKQGIQLNWCKKEQIL